MNGTAEESAVITDIFESLELMADGYQWPFERVSDTEVTMEALGYWGKYAFFFGVNVPRVYLNCSLKIKVPERKRLVLYELLALVNTKLSLGAFVFDTEEEEVYFQYTLYLYDSNVTEIGTSLMAKIVETVVVICESFYPAFQAVIIGDKPPAIAVKTGSIIPHIGVA